MVWAYAGLYADSLTSQFGGPFVGDVTVLEHGTPSPDSPSTAAPLWPSS